MIPKPLVSIVMPVFNCLQYIEQSIDSVLNQTYRNIEFIICDDNSNDGTQYILHDYAKKDSRIVLLINEKNEGISRSINKCLSKSSGKYIARMDADDIMVSNRISEQVVFLEEFTEIGLCGSSIILIDENGNAIKSRLYPLSHQEIIAWAFRYHPFCNPSMMYRKDVMLRCGELNHMLDGAEDYDYNLRILMNAKAANIEAALLQYRVHSGSISSTKARRQELLTLYIRLKAWVEYGYPARIKDVAYSIMQLASMCIIPQKYKRALFNYIR